MPSWKKVVVSGSDASFTSLYVTNAVTASAFTGSFIGDGSGLTNLTYGDFATGSFTSQATWSFTHNLGFKYAAIEVYDQNDFVIIPSETKIIDAQSVEIRFTSPQTGTALATLGTGVVSGSVFDPSALLTKASFNTYTGSTTSQFAGTASYALTSSFSLAATANTVLVINKSGNTITKGTVVHLTGSNNSSDTPYVTTASYENDNLSANTLGIATQNIAFNSTGYITTEGVLTGINVTGFVAGQVLYLGTGGTIIGSAPQAPLHGVRLGQVVRDSPSNNGSIYVRVDNGYELDELHDVRITTASLSYGDLLMRSQSVWINTKQLSGSYAITGSLGATSFTGSLLSEAARISGSLTLSGSAVITGSLTITGSANISSSLTTSVFTIATQPTTSYTARQILMRNSASGQVEITDSTSPAIYNFGMSYAMSTFNYLT